KAGLPALAIHGNKSQSARQKALDAFKSGRTRILVATDVAARGPNPARVRRVRIPLSRPNATCRRSTRHRPR
ncbi:DEAD/DEAH box helicase, partial [Lysobacter pythonis]